MLILARKLGRGAVLAGDVPLHSRAVRRLALVDDLTGMASSCWSIATAATF